MQKDISSSTPQTPHSTRARPLRSTAHSLVASASKESNLSNRETKAVLRSAFLENIGSMLSDHSSSEEQEDLEVLLAAPGTTTSSSSSSSFKNGGNIAPASKRRSGRRKTTGGRGTTDTARGTRDIRSKTREELRGKTTRAMLAAAPVLS